MVEKVKAKEYFSIWDLSASLGIPYVFADKPYIFLPNKYDYFEKECKDYQSSCIFQYISWQFIVFVISTIVLLGVSQYTFVIISRNRAFNSYEDGIKRWQIVCLIAYFLIALLIWSWAKNHLNCNNTGITKCGIALAYDLNYLLPVLSFLIIFTVYNVRISHLVKKLRSTREVTL